MKDLLSLFLLKHTLESKMKKGLRNLCNDNGSTSTLNQHTFPAAADNKYWQNAAAQRDHHQYRIHDTERQPTLEEMILKLDLEEDIARKSKALQLMQEGHEDDDNVIMRGQSRMSCVDNSDILRSARNALNQYPRFSLDGRDAMYRSSFRNKLHLQQKDAGNGKRRPSISREHFEASSSTTRSLYPRRDHRFPATLAGESVVWCKPGVVAKLMGLDAIPVPSVCVGANKLKGISNEKLSYMLKQSRPGDQRREMDKRSTMQAIDHTTHNCRRFSNCKIKGKAVATDSCSTASKSTEAGKYGIMKAVVTNHHPAPFRL